MVVPFGHTECRMNVRPLAERHRPGVADRFLRSGVGGEALGMCAARVVGWRRRLVCRIARELFSHVAPPSTYGSANPGPGAGALYRCSPGWGRIRGCTRHSI